jgi:hypothetical protein
VDFFSRFLGDEEQYPNSPQSEYPTDIDYLESPELELDSRDVRESQVSDALKASFRMGFPFDVINLDLERYMFRPKEGIPGRLILALRRVFEWQQRPIRGRDGSASETLSEFDLFFITRIGPADLRQHSNTLRCCLAENLQRDPDLAPLLEKRSGTADINILYQRDFDRFFVLGMQKLLAQAAIERDWYIDPVAGIRVIEFERNENTHPYKMLHLAMTLKRPDPPEEKRPPQFGRPQLVAQAYAELVHSIFSRPEELITIEDIPNDLQPPLEKIMARRKMYMEGN